jgi:hypothetical protein
MTTSTYFHIDFILYLIYVHLHAVVLLPPLLRVNQPHLRRVYVPQIRVEVP